MRTFSLVGLLSLLLGGCSYESQYAAASDGRARAVWSKNQVVLEPAGAPISGYCAGELLRLSGAEVLRAPVAVTAQYGPEGGYAVYGGGYWAPRYYGPSIVVVRPGLAPLLPVRPLYMAGGLRGGVVAAPAAVTSGTGSGPRLGGGSGGGGDAGKGLALLALLALVVLPVIDVSVALTPPEKIGPSANAIDQVNAFNDLARSSGTPCSYGATP